MATAESTIKVYAQDAFSNPSNRVVKIIGKFGVFLSYYIGFKNFLGVEKRDSAKKIKEQFLRTHYLKNWNCSDIFECLLNKIYK